MRTAKRQLVGVFEDSKRTGSCNGPTCGQPLDWYDTAKGKRMPMNAGAVPVRSENEPDTMRVIVFFDASDTHWATCPDRKRF